MRIKKLFILLNLFLQNSNFIISKLIYKADGIGWQKKPAP